MKRGTGVYQWDFAEALKRDTEIIESSRYSFHLTQWPRDSGADNVLCVIYDDLIADPRAYLTKICEFVGAEPPKTVLDAAPARSDDNRVPSNYHVTHVVMRIADWLYGQRLGRIVRIGKAFALRRFLLENGKPFPPLDPALARLLREQMKPEVDALEKLINRDLSAWREVNNLRDTESLEQIG